MTRSFRAGYEYARHYLGLDPDSSYPDGPPPPGSSSEDEHRAVLELLVATMYADATISEQELVEIDRYGADNGWNTPTFSFVQAFGSATSLVRQARMSDGGLEALLDAIAPRITTPELRTRVTAACRMVVEADGATVDAESSWLASVAASFGG